MNFAFVNSIETSSKNIDHLSFKYIVLCKAKALLFEHIDQLLIGCTNELAIAHSKSYLEEALGFRSDSLTPIEKGSLNLHVSCLQRNKCSDGIIKRVQDLIGSDQIIENCPICHSGLYIYFFLFYIVFIIVIIILYSI